MEPHGLSAAVGRVPQERFARGEHPVPDDRSTHGQNACLHAGGPALIPPGRASLRQALRHVDPVILIWDGRFPRNSLQISMATLRKFSLLTILLSFFIIPSHFTAEERPITFNFWPLFQYTSDPVEGVREIEGLGPFFHWKEDSHQKEWGIRPLLFWKGDEDESLWRLEFLYPFGKYETKEGNRRGYLFPISIYKEQRLDGGKKFDFQLFPFFVGETEKEESYFGFFPFYGTLLDHYGKDEIRFYFWPLYSESISEGVQTRNYLWPFFSFTEGETKKGYRIWPFYGQKEEFGVSKSEFILWPVFVNQTKGLDTEDPVENWMVFPFYVSKESKRFESKTVLWPFFSHTRDRLTGFKQWDLPWPFFRSLRGENLYGIRIFPIYGFKEKEGEWKRIFVLYPLLKLEEYRVGDVWEKTIRILLFTQIRKGEDNQGVKKGRSLRIWPFLDYERGETGRETFFVFYLFPFRDEGLERNLFPLFRIFRWEKDPQGGSSSDLFWGLYKRRKTEETDSWEISHLMGLRRGKGWKTISFLKGLFWHKNDGTSADFRLFYLPFHIRWSYSHPENLPLGDKQIPDSNDPEPQSGW